ncbi:MAG: OPT/YSL family transporter, partial [Bacteroidota bacterium]|nr:OPT/YSL family transporter [Bacteroidota bacterium]
FVSSRSKDEAVNSARQEKGTLIASGFIAGGALMGVVSVILKFLKVDICFDNWQMLHGEQVAIIPFLLLIGYMIYASMKKDK